MTDSNLIRVGLGLPYGMAIYQSVLSPDLCSRVMDYFDTQPKEKGNNKINGCERMFEEIFLDDEKMQSDRFLRITYNKLRSHIGQYLDEHIAFEEFRNQVKEGCYDLQPRMKKYKAGDAFPIHSDDSSVLALSRKFAYILYLNDNYVGGNTVFRSGSAEVARIKAQQGALAVFPVHPIFMHEGEKVQEGSKYILNGFVTVLTSSARLVSSSGAMPTRLELVEHEIGLLAASLKVAARKMFRS